MRWGGGGGRLITRIIKVLAGVAAVAGTSASFAIKNFQLGLAETSAEVRLFYYSLQCMFMLEFTFYVSTL